MNASGGLTRIRAVLEDIERGEFATAARSLLAELGYRSDRTLSDQTGDVNQFIERYPARKAGTQSEDEFRDEDPTVRIVFQVTDAEIDLPPSDQQSLFEFPGFETGNARSFLFVTVELRADTYPRHAYAQITREINKRFSMPAVVLFRTAGDLLSLAFVHRRPHKRDPQRDVLGSVSLIREINPADPHRAHVDILEELSLSKRLAWMESRGKARNFDGLLDAWLDALDTEELNKRFYRELFDWFTRAVEEARFPTTEARTLDPEEHVIRLITRVLFVWFIKEKGLVADALFIEDQIKPLLKSYNQETGDSYYRAVLQNLFFATLNTEIGRRGFSQVSPTTHRSFSLYRFRNEMTDPDALVRLFDRTPFINGGLFDCQDSEKSTTRGGYRIDCFSDNLDHRSPLSIPNRLFFGPTGLIDMFNRYRFTVEENTPTEQEVALDPELLGKVFENLLAAYNPETRDTARKQTGSYYTPRRVVDYMVDEALVTSMASSAPPHDGDTVFWKDRLHYLLDHADAFDDAEGLFTSEESESIIRSIAKIKVIDPAAGSGAFPMAILQKLTLALRRLDRHNRLWETLQKEIASDRARSAFDTTDQDERVAELKEISDTFEKYRQSDFGRKLYLIQNSIFGVDIQPIACQIAKLRFFISLAIEQDPDLDADNFGIKPLPNLETRFVAADTLLGLECQQSLNSERARHLENELHANRQRHFHATTRQHKLVLSDESKELRAELSAELRLIGMPASDAARVANWDPYDQNASARWFNPDYMFGVSHGFDIVIGNPPYIQLQRDHGKLAKRYKSAGLTTFIRSGDIYQLFYERGCQLLKERNGILAYITSNSWMRSLYGKTTRRYLTEKHEPLYLIEMGKDVFDAIVDTSVLFLRVNHSQHTGRLPAVDMDKSIDGRFPPNNTLEGYIQLDGDTPWSILSPIEYRIFSKIMSQGTPLYEWDVTIHRGIVTGYNKAFIVDEDIRNTLIANDAASADIVRPILRGRDIQRYQVEWAGKYLIATIPTRRLDIDNYPAVKRHLLSFGRSRLAQAGRPLIGGGRSRKKTSHAWFELQDSIAYHNEFSREKLFWMHMSSEARFAYSSSPIFCNQKAFVITGDSLKYLCAVLNSRLVTWLVRHIGVTTGMGLVQWDKFTVVRIPIPQISPLEQRPFIHLIDEILTLKKTGPSVSIIRQEKAIDQLVYRMYDLADEEVRAVETSVAGQFQSTKGDGSE